MAKKGFFYSLSAVLLLIILSIIFYFSANESSLKEEVMVQEVKIEIANNYIQDFENYYLESMLSILSKQTFSAISNHASTTGPVPNLKEAVKNLVERGSYDSMSIDFTITSLMNSFQESLMVDVKTNNLTLSVDEITQPDPWTIEVTYTIRFEFGNLDSTWNDTLTKDVFITVYGLEDPQYHQRISKAYWSASPLVPCLLEKLGYACSVEGVCPFATCP